MSGIASATGLLEARIRPVYRPKLKQVELSGSTKPAPFILRPFSGLFNPYPYGCSVLCNHPADCEAKEVLRRAKNSWATEGKALLLPEEMDMIKANLVASNRATDIGKSIGMVVNNDPAIAVPEELFRKYTETDSRPATPAPTLASGPPLTNRQTHEEFPVTCIPRERTTLVLDLRTNTHKQLETETFTWHALTLEPLPSHRKAEIFISKPTSRRTSEHVHSPKPPVDVTNIFPSTDTCNKLNSNRSIKEKESENQSKEIVVLRRRGKRLRKGKHRRGSAYGQQTEVRDLFEPTETQVSHIGDGSRSTSIYTNNDDTENLATSPEKISALSNTPSVMPPSFIDPDILKHLCRELDNDKVEAEFSIRENTTGVLYSLNEPLEKYDYVKADLIICNWKNNNVLRKIAFEEALRVKGELSRARRQIFSNPALVNTPRVFSRQTARFEILGSESLCGLTVLEYLNKHVFISSGRKLIFSKAFSKFEEDTLLGNTRYILPNNIREALQDVIGKPIIDEQVEYLKSMIGEIKEPLNFRTWCGLCAAVERLICPLPLKEVDPPTWLERADFEILERRLDCTRTDATLVQFLREICKK